MQIKIIFTLENTIKLKILEIIKDKAFWINLILAILLFNVLIWLTLQFLKVYTHHSETIKVPIVKMNRIETAVQMLEDADLTYEVTDSIFNPNVKNGTVLEQIPFGGAIVKSGRKIFLTISTSKPPYVEMPSLVGRSSLRFAKIELESRGLVLGELTYIPSAEKDAVLEQNIGSTPIKPGTMIPKGTVINLTLGDGLSGMLVDVPFLIGMKASEAEMTIKGYSLVMNAFYDADVLDSANGIIYKQYPSAIANEQLNFGEPIDVFVGRKLPDYILKDTAIMNRINH